MKTQLKRTLTLLLALTLLAGILSPSASAVDQLDERIKSIGLRNTKGDIIGKDESLSIAAGNKTYFYVFPADENGKPISGLYSFLCTIDYESSDTSIADFNSYGNIIAYKAGQTTITVSLPDHPEIEPRSLTLIVTNPEYLCGLCFYTTNSVSSVDEIKSALVDCGVAEAKITTSTNSVQVAAVDVGSNALRNEYLKKFGSSFLDRDAAEFAQTVNNLFFGGNDVIFPYTMQSFYYSANDSSKNLFIIYLDRLPGDAIPVDPERPVTIKLVNLDDTVTDEDDISEADITTITGYNYGEYFDVNMLYPGAVDNPVTSWSYATLTANGSGGYSVDTDSKKIASAVLLYDDVLNENDEVVLFARHDSPPYYVRVVVIENDSDNTDLIASNPAEGYVEIDGNGRYNPVKFEEAVLGEDDEPRDDTIPITISQYNTIYPNNQFTKPDDYPALLEFMSKNGLLESGDLEIYNAKAHRYHNALDGTENRRFGGGSLVMLTYVVSFKTPTVEIKPADITIYMGGDGYEGAVDADGNELGVTNGFPVPGFTIEPADNIANFDPTSAVLTYDDGTSPSRSWYVVPYDGEIGDSMPAHGIYRFEPHEGSNTHVKMRFFDKDLNKYVDSDSFDIEGSLGKDLKMEVYGESIEMGYVKLVYGGAEYAVTSGNGTLKVRSTTGDEDYGSVVERERDVHRGESGVLAHAGTTYYINNKPVEVVDASGVKLLFDDIVEDNSVDVTNTQLLINRADSELGGASATRRYEAKYLDLVDTSNGNAWVAADKDITVYWPLPAGTGWNTNFTLLHFKGLHRDMGVDVIESGINSCDVTPVTVENTGTHIKFTVSRAGFSPFVLIWDEFNAPVTPLPENKPADLNTEDHVAYIIGYEDGTVRPGANITRAEVATIFFRLLTDETRESYWSQSSGFSDVPAGAWYNNAVSTLTRAGILDGYEDGSFRPNASITRAEFTKIAVSFFKHVGGAFANPFSDVPESAWYAEFVKAAAELGLIDGYEDGTFRPNAPITRAEACTIVNRTLGRAPDKDHLLPEHEMLTWPDNSRDAWYYAQIQEATNSHDYQWLGGVEVWTAKLPERDWDALEKEWSNAYSAPGGEVAR